MKLIRFGFLFGVLLLPGCSADDQDGFSIFSNSFDFNESLYDWQADYTDYPVNVDVKADSVYKWESFYTSLPEYLGSGRALKLSSENIHGAIFMFIKKRMSGFRPNTNYNVAFELEFATNALPGQGVILKVGASDLEPRKVIENDYYVLNIDKGLPYADGENLIAIGEIGSAVTENTYNNGIKKNPEAAAPIVIKSNSRGEIWIVIGTDSTYWGNTTIYYKKVSVVFSASA